MTYIYWDVDPVIFRAWGMPIHYYSLLFILGTVVSVWILKRVYVANGIPWAHLQLLVVMSTVSLFVGARLGHCLLYESSYYWSRPLEIFLPITVQPDGELVFRGYRGMASHGGAIAWIVALCIYSRITGENIVRTLDAIALVLPLAACTIRLGNLMNSEMIGISTDLPWAFVFERVDTVPRHPAALYEALAYGIVFGVELLLYRKFGFNRFRGLAWGVMLILVFGARFGIEFLKERQVPFEEQMSLDMGQVLSLPFILMGGCFLVRVARQGRR